MSEPFRKVYSDLYNTLYADKDYEGEVDLLERVFNAITGAGIPDDGGDTPSPRRR